MSKLVVTGGAGFIGSQLVRTLLSQGAPHVHVVDNFYSGKAGNLDEVRSQITLHQADIREYNAVAPIVRGAKVVYHLAAIPSVPKSIADPEPSHDVNINGTFQVLRACASGKVGRVVYAGSSSAYGNTEVLPKVETMQPRPLSPYAAQKLMGEYYSSAFANCFGIETVALRFFNVFGPRQDPSSPYSGVLSIFMKCLIGRRSPTIFGDGEQSRDFTYVEDVAELCVRASEAAGVSGRMYNAGNGNRYTLNQVWDRLQKIEGVDLPPHYGPSRAGDVRDSQADTARAMRDLHHQPRFSLEEGLKRTLAWYKTQAADKSH